MLESITDYEKKEIGTYTYNADGIRYSKTAGGVTTKFYYNGTTLMGEDRSDGKKLRYCYDQEGICGFRYYNGSEWKAYTYVKNLQGDIILIKDGLGAPKVKYEYDPWGNVTPVALNLDGGEPNPDEEELAKINPFRYRGYYYDEESKLYYLITRYYDPWVGQFISPDSFEYLDPGTIGGINLYAYCNYNPIMYVDPTGQSFVVSFIFAVLAGAITGGVVGGIKAEMDGDTFISGFLSGALVGGALGGATMLAIGGKALGGIVLSSYVAKFGLLAGAASITLASTTAAGMGAYAIKESMNGRSISINEMIRQGINTGIKGGFAFVTGMVLATTGVYDYLIKGIKWTLKMKFNMMLIRSSLSFLFQIPWRIGIQ